MIEITSSQNQILKTIRKLHTGSFREKSGETVLEGERLVMDSARYGCKIETVLIREDYAGEIPCCENVYKVSKHVFDSLSETKTPQGILATVSTRYTDVKDVFRGGLVVFCDRVQDPGNLGTIFRTAHAVGADGIVLRKGCADPFSPKTVRASMGSVFSLPVAKTDEYYKDPAYKAYCGALTDRARNLYTAAFPKETMIVLGNEANGASEDVLGACDETLLIPMPGGAESLNVAVAGAVTMYEYFRQVQNVY